MYKTKLRFFSFFLVIAISLAFWPVSFALEDNYGEWALAVVEKLNDMAPRTAGTKSEAAAAEWLREQLEDIGYDVYTQPFSYYLGFTDNSQNVIVKKQGASEKMVVVTAHYDCVNINGSKGADDNASGTAAALETAKRIFDAQLPYTTVFVFSGAEEMGLHGSKAYLNSLTKEEKANVILNINIDSILAGDTIYMNGGSNGRSRGMVIDGKAVVRRWGHDQMTAAIEDLGLDISSNPGVYRPGESFYPAPTTGAWSDHDPFDEAGIPYVYFEAGNWDLPAYNGQNQTEEYGPIIHTSYDSLTWIEEHFPGRALDHLASVTRLMEQFLLNVEEPETAAWEDANYDALTPMKYTAPTVTVLETSVLIEFGFPIHTYNSAPTAQNFILTDAQGTTYPVLDVDYTWIDSGIVSLHIDSIQTDAYPTTLSFQKFYNLLVKEGTTEYVGSFSTKTEMGSVELTSPVCTLVADRAANIPVTFDPDFALFTDTQMYVGLFKDEELIQGTQTALSGISATIRLASAPEAGDYTIAVFDGVNCYPIAQTSISIVPEPTDLWVPSLINIDGKLTIVFAEPITLNVQKQKAELGGRAIQAVIGADEYSLATDVDYESLSSDSTLVIGGIKYPRLYPSYVFTFTLKTP